MRLTHEVNLKVSVDSIQGTVLFSPLFGNGWGERAKGRERGDERGGNENECVVESQDSGLLLLDFSSFSTEQLLFRNQTIKEYIYYQYTGSTLIMCGIMTPV